PGLAVTNRYGFAQVGRNLTAQDVHSWNGTALGADAYISVAHADASEGAKILAACQAEIDSIESIFSLHREESTLSSLNTQGEVSSGPDDFFELLSISKDIYAATEGYFDPSVQPLWSIYASEIKPDFNNEALLFEKISDCRHLIGFEQVDVKPTRIKFRRPGMALTMNGIAQGYLTDKIVALLRRSGIRSALVQTGETYGIGTHADGHAWRLGVPDPKEPGQLTRIISLEDRAVATSAPMGTTFDRAGRFHHLFDPHTGQCARDWSSVTVKAPSAAIADALSTAFSAMPQKMILDTVQLLPEVGVHMVGSDGTIRGSGLL
ncbi:MAG TPA: thiamine biosynthesis protein ApbE, partial [Rhodospirillaceae bacterium]|nr:thiamine biosynthesis protein ApbE [Rhodospirillaceae bacterium]